MVEHINYWSELLRCGVAVAFGPVLDPDGVWGAAVLEAENEHEAERIRANDPVVKAGIGTVVTYPMRGFVRPHVATT